MNPFRKKSPAPPQESAAPVDRDASVLRALGAAYAVVEFDAEGTVRHANSTCLNLMGYKLDEIVGSQHRIFMDPHDAASDQYQAFWGRLASGESISGIVRRLTKAGQHIWLQASYVPVRGPEGRVESVIKIAQDVTDQRRREDRVFDQFFATIEFRPDGSIRGANDKFLAATGYSLNEIQNQHHRMFMPAGEADSPEYARFWQDLARGQAKQGAFQRVTKSGSELHIQASYTPVEDSNGDVYKIVKVAIDITAEKEAAESSRMVGSTIYSGLSELSEAANEISSSIARNATLAGEVADRAHTALQSVEELNANSRDINGVLEIIGKIADQTNLLALNATIEAARAGESGKGFSVVASEVKDLARQTKEATDDIAPQLEAIAASVARAAEVVNSISEGIGEVSGNSSTVAAAVEEQSSVIATLSSEATRLVE